MFPRKLPLLGSVKPTLWKLPVFPRKFQRSAVVTAVLLFGATVILTATHGFTPARAIGGSGTSGGINSNTFYVYLRAGEQLDYRLEQSVTITDHSGTVQRNCTGSPPSPCAFTEAPATDDGVWIVQVAAAGDHLRPWNIRALTTSGAEIPGRVWTEQMSFTNTARNYRQPREFTAYYLSEFGVQYRAHFQGHIGWGFDVRATNRGTMVNDGSCLPAYRSIVANDTNYVLDSPSCRASGLVNYRIFYGEPPAPDLPSSTPNWGDGRTQQTWVLPTYQNPQLQNWSYVRDNSMTAAGKLVGSLSGQPGTLEAHIDTTGDGDFSDPEDVVIRQAANLGSYEIPWNGLDKLGNAVPLERDLTFRVNYHGEAEIHYIDFDVEGRMGGIEATRLNGPGAPDRALSWNDSHLPIPANPAALPPVPLHADRLDSLGGVHTWPIVPRSVDGWGNI